MYISLLSAQGQRGVCFHVETRREAAVGKFKSKFFGKSELGIFLLNVFLLATGEIHASCMRCPCVCVCTFVCETKTESLCQFECVCVCACAHDRVCVCLCVCV